MTDKLFVVSNDNTFSWYCKIKDDMHPLQKWDDTSSPPGDMNYQTAWKPGMIVRIFYHLRFPEDFGPTHMMISHKHYTPGTFIASRAVTPDGQLGAARIVFHPAEQELSTKSHRPPFYASQYERVVAALVCPAHGPRCGCFRARDIRHDACASLILDGVVTLRQLDAIFKEIDAE